MSDLHLEPVAWGRVLNPRLYIDILDHKIIQEYFALNQAVISNHLGRRPLRTYKEISIPIFFSRYLFSLDFASLFVNFVMSKFHMYYIQI